MIDQDPHGGLGLFDGGEATPGGSVHVPQREPLLERAGLDLLRQSHGAQQGGGGLGAVDALGVTFQVFTPRTRLEQGRQRYRAALGAIGQVDQQRQRGDEAPILGQSGFERWMQFLGP